MDNEILGRIARTVITRGDVVGVLNDGYLFLSNKYKINGNYHPNRANAPKDDFRLQWIGANPPATLVQLYEYLNRIILSVLGVPIELVTAADGTGKREARRQFS